MKPDFAVGEEDVMSTRSQSMIVTVALSPVEPLRPAEMVSPLASKKCL